MRIIATSNLAKYAEKHPETLTALVHWQTVAKAANWKSTQEVLGFFTKAKVLNAERVRFEIAGGNYRLIVSFNFVVGIAFIKFIGTHAEYDKINALTVSQF
ncbi:type II toxin-antitoxin system HigB family toxin [Oleomonas cavernae]|uniref:Type II toxin-antitoxin system HigB family toxin n=1 Tax=Oleomonas cavernae TaxID=2320859 RepID=A0A418WUL9_9PROT|nr:type II toxin-antitoxin system HigB family toxin [Oleomonas cavernae]RJF94886.1 type II toxin-antitoxin system HigB family toxin [Oleomonas cavernae]